MWCAAPDWDFILASSSLRQWVDESGWKVTASRVKAAASCSRCPPLKKRRSGTTGNSPRPWENREMANTLVTTDPPDHRTLRNLVNRAFTPRAVTRLSHRVTQITQQLLDAVKATGHMDVGPTPKHLTLTPGALVCGLSMLAHPTAVSTSSVVELAAQGSLQT